MSASTEKAQDSKTFAVNVNAGGKVHRLVLSTTGRSREKRAICGWIPGAAVANAKFCKRVAAGQLCRKCFREANAPLKNAGLEGDAIDDFE